MMGTPMVDGENRSNSYESSVGSHGRTGGQGKSTEQKRQEHLGLSLTGTEPAMRGTWWSRELRGVGELR